MLWNNTVLWEVHGFPPLSGAVDEAQQMFIKTAIWISFIKGEGRSFHVPVPQCMEDLAHRTCRPQQKLPMALGLEQCLEMGSLTTQSILGSSLLGPELQPLVWLYPEAA